MSYNPSNPNGQETSANSQPVVIANDQSAVPVSGTFYQATQPVSVASLPLPTGAATEATLSTLNGKVTAVDTGAVVVSSSALPTGAATSAKQPALGTAGTASSDVITVQGITSMTPLKVDGSAVTQPVSGTFWQATQPVSGSVTANAGTNLNTSLLALDSTVAKDASLTTLNTSVNTLLKPANTLAAVTTVTTVGTVTNITNQGQIVDNAAFTDGTTRLNMSGYIFDEVAGTALTENDGAAARIDSKRAQVFTIEDATTRGQRLAISSTGAASVSQVGSSTSTNALTEVDSTALASSQVIKNGAGRLYRLSGVNTGPAQYIQVFNATSAPANGTAPILLCYAPALSNFSFDLGNFGKYFSTGITVTNSTTAATKTLGSADCWFNAGCL